MPFQVRNVSRSPSTRGLRRRAIGTVKRTLWVGVRRVAPGRTLVISDDEFAKLAQQLKDNVARGAAKVFELNEQGGLGQEVDFSGILPAVEVKAESVPVVPVSSEEAPPEPADTPEPEVEEDGDPESRLGSVAEEAASDNESVEDTTVEDDEEAVPVEIVVDEEGAADDGEGSEEVGEPAKVYKKAELMGMKKDALQGVYLQVMGEEPGAKATKGSMSDAILDSQK